MKKKIFFALALVLVCLFSLTVVSSAEERLSELPKDEWEGFKEALPEEATRYFSNGALDGQAFFADELEEFLTPRRMISVIFELFGDKCGEFLSIHGKCRACGNASGVSRLHYQRVHTAKLLFKKSDRI